MKHTRQSLVFAAAAGCLALCGVLPAQAQTAAPGAVAPSAVDAVTPAPAELAPYGNGWSVKGAGALRFFGFKAYDATLWLPSADTSFSFARPFALDIRYATALKGREISNTSIVEMQRIAPSSPEQIVAWSRLLESMFVDVKAGDRLIGVHLPREGIRLFQNGKLLGESGDTAFSEAFFKIWLDPKTKRPDLRNALLGQTARP